MYPLNRQLDFTVIQFSNEGWAPAPVTAWPLGPPHVTNALFDNPFCWRISVGLTRADIEQYDRDGFLLVEELFSPEEVTVLIDEISGDRVAANLRLREDGSGKTARLSIWHELGNDIWAAASTDPRIVNSVRLLVGEDVSFPRQSDAQRSSLRWRLGLAPGLRLLVQPRFCLPTDDQCFRCTRPGNA